MITGTLQKQHPVGRRQMAKPTPSDPLGLRADPGSPEYSGDSLAKMIDDRIAMNWCGRTTRELDGFADSVLALELIARGWAVFKPTIQGT